MPVSFVGRRLLCLASARPIRVKHHVFSNPSPPPGGSSSDRQHWLACDHKTVPSGSARAPFLLVLPCDAWSGECRSCSTVAASPLDGNQPTSGRPESCVSPANSIGGRKDNAASRAGPRGQCRMEIPGAARNQPANLRGGAVKSLGRLQSKEASSIHTADAFSRSTQLQATGERQGTALQLSVHGGAERALVERAMQGATRWPASERGRPVELQQLWALVQAGQAKEVQRVLQGRLTAHEALSIKGFNYLLKACATGKRPKMQLGLELYAGMEQWGVAPDAKSIGWMLRLFARAGELEQALSWLARERTRLCNLVSAETGVPLSPAYFLNVLLEECITRQDWAAAGRCADHLGHYGLDAKTFLLLLQAGGLERRPAAVDLTWATLCDAGLGGSPAHHSAYIQALSRCGLLDRAIGELHALGGNIRQKEAGRTGPEEGHSNAAQQRGQELALPSKGAKAVQTGAENGGGGDGQPSEGLWWEAPPPRATDKSTLAHLRMAYNAIIAAAARSKDVNTAEKLFAEMRRADLQPDRFTYNALLRAVAAERGLEDTQRVYRGMQAGGILADQHTVTALVSAHTAVGQLEQAVALLEETPPEIYHNRYQFNALLEAAKKQGDVALALRVFRQMRALGVRPDACTYLALFQALQPPKPSFTRPETGRLVRKQLLLLEEDMCASGVAHTPQTITALVAALGPGSVGLLLERVAHAKQVAQQGQAVPLDARFFAVAISVCAAAQDLPAALSLLDTMAVLGVAPDVAVYNAAINACAQAHDVRRGLHLMEQALREGITADTVTLNTVIKLCCLSGQLRACLPLLFRAEAAGAWCDTMGYNLLLRTALDTDDLATLERLLERMKRRSVPPDGDTCLVAVQAYLCKESPDEAAEALDALTARMFGHGGTSLEVTETEAESRMGFPVDGGVPSGRESERAAGKPPEWGPSMGSWRSQGQSIQRSEAARMLHGESRKGPEAQSEEDWEFVGDSVEQERPGLKEEKAETVAITKQAMLCPAPEAQNQFLARMVGVSGRGYEGPPHAWEERAAVFREIDWNSWARRLRQQYDARKATGLRPSTGPERAAG